MRYLAVLQGNATTEAGYVPSAEEMAGMGAYVEHAMREGWLLATEDLLPSARATRVALAGGDHTVTDGPFTESKELIAGFWLIQAKSKEEAIEWMRRAPFGGGVELEIRQLFETDDFAASDPTGELRASEERLRAQVEANR